MQRQTIQANVQCATVADCARNTSYWVGFEAEAGSEERAKAAESSEGVVQAALLRCIFGNPFRPVAVNPEWLALTVQSLAAAIYEERAFDRLPILGDALEDAGCANQDILSHCRGGGEHVRGCWVVDLLLGRG